MADSSGWFTHISGHPSAAGRAQDRESSPVRDRRSSTVLRHQPVNWRIAVLVQTSNFLELSGGIRFTPKRTQHRQDSFVGPVFCSIRVGQSYNEIFLLQIITTVTECMFAPVQSVYYKANSKRIQIQLEKRKDLTRDGTNHLFELEVPHEIVRGWVG